MTENYFLSKKFEFLRFLVFTSSATIADFIVIYAAIIVIFALLIALARIISIQALSTSVLTASFANAFVIRAAISVLFTSRITLACIVWKIVTCALTFT